LHFFLINWEYYVVKSVKYHDHSGDHSGDRINLIFPFSGKRSATCLRQNFMELEIK